MAFGTSIRLSNIKENWLFQFGFSNGDTDGNGAGGFDIVKASSTAGGNNNLLRGAISSSSATSIDVDDSRIFSVGDYIKINDGSNPEIVKITSISALDSINVTRGQLGTSATTHSDDGKLYWNNFLGFAFTDTTYEGTYYRGVITNKPSIRESLDVLKGTTKTSNVSITIPDFDYSGAKISKELFGGTKVYVNQEVKVFCQINDDTPTQIGSFRLVDISSNGDSLNLSLQNKTPWDYITIPNTETYGGVKAPVIYGEYTPNSTNTFMTGRKLYPAPRTNKVGRNIYYISANDISGSLPHYYDEGLDMFVRLNYTNDSENRADGIGEKSVPVDHTFDRGTYLFRPQSLHQYDGDGSVDASGGTPNSRYVAWSMTNSDFETYMIDANASTRGLATMLARSTESPNGIVGTFDALHARFSFKMPEIQGILTEFKVFIKATLTMTSGTNTDANTDNSGNRLTFYEVTYGDNSPERTKVLEVKSATPITSNQDDTTSSLVSGYTDYEQIDLLSKYQDLSDSGKDLAFDITATQSFILTDSSWAIEKGTIIKVESELMKVEHSQVWSGTSYGILGVERGYNNTTPASIDVSGASVDANIYIVGDGGYVAPTHIGFRVVADLTNTNVATTTQQVGGTLEVYDVFVKLSVSNDFTREPVASETFVKNIKQIYLGNDGLIKSWDSGAITLITDAHLDLLIRFAGLTKADGEAISNPSSDVEGYSTLKDARDNNDTWGIRYWCLESTALKKVLEQMAFEGGFWFRYKNDGSPQYGFIRNNTTTTNLTLSDSSTIACKFGKYDIDKVSIKLTPLSSVVTKRRIAYNRHPATGDYLGNDNDAPVIVAEDTTNNYRKTFNIKTAENIEEVSLDMLISNIGDTNIGNDDRNDTFASYYGDINGRVKLLVSCTIVNPKFYGLEVGNVVEFDNDNMYPEVPFGVNSGSWNNLKFVVTSVGRSLGKLKIEVREI